LGQRPGLIVVFLNPTEPDDLATIEKVLSTIDEALGIERSGRGGSERKITVKPLRELRGDHPLEAAMAEWSAAIEAGDIETAWAVLESRASEGAFEPDDPTCEGLGDVRARIQGFRCAGFRWVEREVPAGLEVWFVGEGEAKIGLLWIPDEDDASRIGGLMVKPVDTEWLGKSF
jgi:hypothetical protein